MKRVPYLLGVLILSLMLAWACSDAGASSPTQVEGVQPQFAQGQGGANKVSPNPVGCSHGDVATWDATNEEWVCSALPSLQHTIVHRNGTAPPLSEGGDIFADIVFCPSGMVATGGGFSVEPGLVVDELMPASDPTPNPSPNYMYLQGTQPTELSREYWLYAFCVADF